MAKLWLALLFIGVERDQARILLTKVGMDSMPQIRRDVFMVLVRAKLKPKDTKRIAGAINQPEQTTRRALEDLEAHKVVRRCSEKRQGKKVLWKLSKWTLRKLQEAKFSPVRSQQP